MTINLEKELIKANQKLMTPEELLVVKEFENNPEFYQDDTLARIGLAANLAKGKGIKERMNAFKHQASRFKQDRVFHVSQIEEVCNKYRLKFLPSVHYKGTIDKDLSFKINAFEAAYQVKCQCDPSWNGGVVYEIDLSRRVPSYRGPIQNTYIVAPASSFELQERPKDPLFFYRINNEYYYLIHKWGNDLSIFRRFLGILSNSLYFYILTTVPSLLAAISSFYNLVTAGKNVTDLLCLCFCFGWTVISTIAYLREKDEFSPLKHNWYSPLKD